MADEQQALTDAFVEIRVDGRLVSVPRGGNLRRALLAAKLSPHRWVSRFVQCGGRADCATCVVRLVSGEDAASVMGPREAELLRRYPAEARLSCQVQVYGFMEVARFPRPEKAPRGEKAER